MTSIYDVPEDFDDMEGLEEVTRWKVMMTWVERRSVRWVPGMTMRKMLRVPPLCPPPSKVDGQEDQGGSALCPPGQGDREYCSLFAMDYLQLLQIFSTF